MVNKDSRPNILIIMTDQQRADTIRALGNPIIQTPALDRLVFGGTSFTSAYCPSPVCVASRCSFLLGEYPHQTGTISNTPMPQDRKSLMNFLNDVEYQTHGIGKMHFSPDSKRLWGFESRDFSEEGSDQDHYRDFIDQHGYDYIAATHGERSEFYYIPQPSQLPERLHHTKWVGDKTLDFLDRRDSSRPFFCWTSFIKPHPPFESPVPWNRLYRMIEMDLPYIPPNNDQLLTYWNRLQNSYKYQDQGLDLNLVRVMRAAYYAAISFIDYNVGRILDRLEGEGILDETLILFTSDHGEFLGDYNCYGKRSFLDSAARIPLLVRYPGRFTPNALCDQPVSLVDVLPTCFSVAGIEKQSQHVGTDLAEIASGESDRDGIIGQLGQEETGLYTLITSNFKYIYSAADQKEWLFRRLANRLEERSLVGNPAFAHVLKAYRNRLIGWFRSDGYEQPIDGDQWREFSSTPSIAADPDSEQLFQDGRSVSDRFPNGYSPKIDPMKPRDFGEH